MLESIRTIVNMGMGNYINTIRTTTLSVMKAHLMAIENTAILFKWIAKGEILRELDFNMTCQVNRRIKWLLWRKELQLSNSKDKLGKFSTWWKQTLILHLRFQSLIAYNLETGYLKKLLTTSVRFFFTFHNIFFSFILCIMIWEDVIWNIYRSKLI
jgi:hypothetical protein